jgi:hypothetical protein
MRVAAALLVSTVVLCSSPTLAQAQLTGDNCVSLTNTIGAGYSASFSDKQFNALQFRRQLWRSTKEGDLFKIFRGK